MAKNAHSDTVVQKSIKKISKKQAAAEEAAKLLKYRERKARNVRAYMERLKKAANKNGE